MILEDYVSFKTAKLLKDSGFNENCCHYYSDLDYHGGRTYVHRMVSDQAMCNSENETPGFLCTAPTLQMARKWLREKFGIEIQTDVCKYGEDRFTKYTWLPIVVTDYSLEFPMDNGGYPPSVGVADTYEEAAESGVVWVLEHMSEHIMNSVEI